LFFQGRSYSANQQILFVSFCFGILSLRGRARFGIPRRFQRDGGMIHACTRRGFLGLAGTAAVAAMVPRSLRAQAGTVRISGTLSVDAEAQVCTVPRDFSGLSYESAQLANPEFFSSSNQQLIRLFRELTPSGVLRLGGGSSEFTTFSEKAPSGPPPFETFGPDTSHTVKSGTVTSALAVRNLRAFLDATGWSCLYGLNLGQGTKENAAAEAEAVHRILGPRLVALQIGNEPDSFRRFRPQGYTPQDYIREWIEFRDAIVARVPDARFAGPDISNKVAYLTAFAAEAPKYPDIVLLTVHYYAMGPAGNPQATMENLLSPDPKLTTLKWKNVSIIEDAMRASHLPCRISEANSCWNGGLEGVSDAFGSALWCADMMLHFASLGMAGVNLHGGGHGWYSPIVGSPSGGFSQRPEFFGMQIAQHFAGAALLRANLQCDSDRVTCYAARTSDHAKGSKLLLLINKTDSPAEIRATGAFLDESRWNGLSLHAASLDTRSGIAFSHRGISRPSHEPLQLAAHSALLLTSH
jgi:hypothetical protein